MAEIKPVIVAKDGVARVGSDIIELEDKSANAFTTDDLDSFIKYISTIQMTPLGDYGIFYSSEQVEFKRLKPDYSSISAATCKLEVYSILDKIMWVENKVLSIDALDEFLYDVRGYYCDSAAKELYDRIQKLSVKKIEHITREKDRQGNFSYSVERKDGEGSVEFPASISFMVPVFQHNENDKVPLVFDLFISFSSANESATISFQLKNPRLQEIVKVARKAIIEKAFTGLPEPKYPTFWGVLNTTRQTDSWKYHKNCL